MPRENYFSNFPLYPDDVLNDDKCEAMTAEAFGAYIRLLFRSWRENPPASLPDDDALLARWAKVKPSRWQKLKLVVLSPFKAGPNGRLLQPRLHREYCKLVERANAQRAGGITSAEKRWGTERRGVSPERRGVVAEPLVPSYLENSARHSKTSGKTQDFDKPPIGDLQPSCNTQTHTLTQGGSPPNPPGGGEPISSTSDPPRDTPTRATRAERRARLLRAAQARVDAQIAALDVQP